jgi:hypothetical protein
MHVDRAVFLSLTAAIAGACATNPGPPVVAATYEVPPPPAVSASTMSVATRPTAASSSAPHRPIMTDVDLAEDDMPSSASESHVSRGPSPSGEGGGAIASSYAYCGKSNARFNAAATGCKDDTGTPGTCSGVRRNGSCGDFPFVRDQCNDYIASLKPGVAERAVRCILGLSGALVCDACNTYRCGYEAVMSACPDPATATECAQITRACPNVTAAECTAYLSGLSSAGRSKMVQCMSGKSACGWGLYSCLESL